MSARRTANLGTYLTTTNGTSTNIGSEHIGIGIALSRVKVVESLNPDARSIKASAFASNPCPVDGGSVTVEWPGMQQIKLV
jgi:hypothetical protein